MILCRDGGDRTVTEESVEAVPGRNAEIKCWFPLDEQEVVRERSKQSGKGLPTGRSYDQEYGNPD